jgi:hypothetical protein
LGIRVLWSHQPAGFHSSVIIQLKAVCHFPLLHLGGHGGGCSLLLFRGKGMGFI